MAITTDKKKSTVLREAFYRKGNPVVAISAPTPLVARMLEKAGIEYIFIGGDATISVMTGKPGQFWGLYESLFLAKLFVEAVEIPVVIDADFLRALGPIWGERAVQEYIKVGLAGCDVDDRILYQGRDAGQFSSRREGKYDPDRLVQSGYSVLSVEDMVEKIEAMDDARQALDPDFILRVRCYAYMTPGATIDEVKERLRAYQAAGADVLYLRQPTVNVDEIKAMKEAVTVPCTTPSSFTLEEAKELGLAEVRYPYAVEAVMHNAAWEFLEDFQQRGIPAIKDWEGRFKPHPFGRGGV